MKNQTEKEIENGKRLAAFLKRYGTEGASHIITDGAACIQVSASAERNRGFEKNAKIREDLAKVLYDLSDALRGTLKGF